jgi:hypothetical protein
MATPTSPVLAASSFSAFIPATNSPLIDKIHGLFGWTMACFVAGAVTCVYSLYQAYQFSNHPAFDLDDNLKLVTCRALLLEDDGKQITDNIQPRLQQCEALLASISDKKLSHEQERLLVKLADLYAKTDLDHAYSIAQRLTFSDCLLSATKSIQEQNPDFDKTKLTSLYEKTSDAKLLELKSSQTTEFLKMSLTDVLWLLDLAKKVDWMSHSKYGNRFFTQAKAFADTLKNPLEEVKALCKIAQLEHEIQSYSSVDSTIWSVSKLIRKMPKEDVIQAHLVLADTYLSIGYSMQMDRDLQKVVKLFDADPATIHKEIGAFAKLIKKINENPTFISGFRNFNIEDLINKALDHINTLGGKDQVEAYLDLASLCQDELEASPAFKNFHWKDVYNEIGALPWSTETEINSKINLLIRILPFFKNDLKGAQALFQMLMLLTPIKTESLEGGWNTARLWKKIIALYIEMGLAEESNAFSQKHIQDIVRQKDMAAEKITQLAFYGSEFGCSTEQKIAALEAAEKLLPQLNSTVDRRIALAQIAEGYFRVDPQKSLAILAEIKDRQAKNCKFIAAVTAIATASLYFDSAVSPLFFLGAAALRLYPSVISYVY